MFPETIPFRLKRNRIWKKPYSVGPLKSPLEAKWHGNPRLGFLTMITTNTAVSVLKMARNVGKFLLHQIKSDLRTKVKIFSLEQTMKAERRRRGTALSLTSALDGGRWLTPRHGFTAGKETLGGPQGRSGRVRKIAPQLGFEPRTAQPVASRYTDWPLKEVFEAEISSHPSHHSTNIVVLCKKRCLRRHTKKTVGVEVLPRGPTGYDFLWFLLLKTKTDPVSETQAFQ